MSDLLKLSPGLKTRYLILVEISWILSDQCFGGIVMDKSVESYMIASVLRRIIKLQNQDPHPFFVVKRQVKKLSLSSLREMQKKTNNQKFEFLEPFMPIRNEM